MNAIECDRCGGSTPANMFQGVHVRAAEGVISQFGYGQQEWDICSGCWNKIFKGIKGE